MGLSAIRKSENFVLTVTFSDAELKHDFIFYQNLDGIEKSVVFDFCKFPESSAKLISSRSDILFSICIYFFAKTRNILENVQLFCASNYFHELNNRILLKTCTAGGNFRN